MRLDKIKRWIKVAASLMAVILSLIFFNLPVSAAGTAIVSVSAPSQPVSPGSQFTVNIVVQPNTAIAGAQFNLSFNPSLVTVNSVTEGSLLKQNGASTYFSAGQIDSNAGTITGVASAIIAPGQTVSTQGTFATITLTAGSANGTATFSLSKVIVGDVTAQSVPLSTVDGQVTIRNGGNSSVIGGGGGEAGGGGGGTLPLVPAVTTPVGSDGTFNQTVDVKSDDHMAEVIVNQNTKGLTMDGKPIAKIEIVSVLSPASPVDQTNVIGNVYDIEPDGSTFNNLINLNLSYDPLLIPEGAAENNLVIATWDSASNQWLDLNSIVNPQNHTVAAKVNHFSFYCVLNPPRPAAFVISNLSVSPGEVNLSDTVKVEVNIKNVGDLKGIDQVTLKMDGSPIGTQIITLAEGANQTIDFVLNPNASGSHILSIDDLSVKLTVNELANTAVINNPDISVTVDGQSKTATGVTPEITNPPPSQVLSTAEPLSVTPVLAGESNPTPVKVFSLHLLAEIIGGAFILITATTTSILVFRRYLIKKS